MQYAICVLAFQAGSGIPFTMRNAMQYAIFFCVMRCNTLYVFQPFRLGVVFLSLCVMRCNTLYVFQPFRLRLVARRATTYITQYNILGA